MVHPYIPFHNVEENVAHRIIARAANEFIKNRLKKTVGFERSTSQKHSSWFVDERASFIVHYPNGFRYNRLAIFVKPFLYVPACQIPCLVVYRTSPICTLHGVKISVVVCYACTNGCVYVKIGGWTVSYVPGSNQRCNESGRIGALVCSVKSQVCCNTCMSIRSSHGIGTMIAVNLKPTTQLYSPTAWMTPLSAFCLFPNSYVKGRSIWLVLDLFLSPGPIEHRRTRSNLRQSIPNFFFIIKATWIWILTIRVYVQIHTILGFTRHNHR